MKNKFYHFSVVNENASLEKIRKLEILGTRVHPSVSLSFRQAGVTGKQEATSLRI